MTTVFDIADAVLERLGPMDTYRLQKLVYFCQGWSLALQKKPLFPERIQAWKNGPVAPALFRAHRGSYNISRVPLREDFNGDASRLTRPQVEVVDFVVERYGRYSGQELAALTHTEIPWVRARGDCPEGASCDEEITLASMERYFAATLAEERKARGSEAPVYVTDRELENLHAMLAASAVPPASLVSAFAKRRKFAASTSAECRETEASHK